MIPNNIRRKIMLQGFKERSNSLLATSILEKLGVIPKSQFWNFYVTYDPSYFESSNSNEQLQDVLPPVEDCDEKPQHLYDFSPLCMRCEYIWSDWELCRDFIPLSSLEGDGGYIYSISKGCIYEIENYQAEDLKNGLIEPQWGTFYEFIDWYLS